MTSTAKALIRNNVEKFLKKEAETTTHTDDKLGKVKSALRYLPEDDCYCIFDPECSIKCVFDEDAFNQAIAKKHNKKDGLDNLEVHVKKSTLDVLFSLDIKGHYILRVVLYVEEFDVGATFNSNKEIPKNINNFPEIQTLLKKVLNAYLKRNNKDAKEHETADNMLSLRIEGAPNFLLRKRIYLKNFYSYIHNEIKYKLPDLVHTLKTTDFKKAILKQANFKDSKVKELKPTKVDLSRIPTSYLEDENVEDEYRQYLKQTSLSNPVSTLSKDVYLKNKRRRTSIAKPTKLPSTIQNLYNEYQNVFANVRLTQLNKYINMQKYKDTISNTFMSSSS